MGNPELNLTNHIARFVKMNACHMNNGYLFLSSQLMIAAYITSLYSMKFIFKENRKVMVTFDGLFGLPRKRAAGVKRREPLLKGLFLLEQEGVNKFVAIYTADAKKEEGYM